MPKQLSKKRKKEICETIVLLLASQGDVFGKPVLRIKSLLGDEPKSVDLATDINLWLDELDGEVATLIEGLQLLLEHRALGALQEEADRQSLSYN
jgi:hypothetical protein